MSHGRAICALLLFITCGAPATRASTELPREIAKCAALAGDLDRLSCFDEIARGEGLAGPRAEPVDAVDTGKWTVRRDVNPVDDSTRVILRLEADSGASRFGEKVALVARCQTNTTEAYIVWNEYVGDDSSSVYQEWKLVTIRIGDAKAVEQKWGVSTDRKATFAPDWAGSLLKEMTQSDRFLAQLTPYGESPMTAIFDTAGLRNALVPLAEACGWAVD